MASLPAEEKVEFLLACLKNTESTPNFDDVATDSGIEKRSVARLRYKSIVEHQTSYTLNGDNTIAVKPGASPVAAPKSIKAAETTNAPSAAAKKRGRPKKSTTESDDDEAEAPTKKVTKPRAKKPKANAKGKNADVTAQAEDSGNDANIKGDDED